MRHPDDGLLRRLVDEPVGVPDADRAHVASCDACLDRFAAVRADADAARAVLAVPAPAVDVDRAWARLSSGSAAAPATAADPAAPARAGRWRAALRRPLVAALGAAVLVGGAGVAAAADWLPGLHTERLAPVTVTSADLVQLPDLSAFGDLQVDGDPGARPVADAAAAQRQSGLTLPQVGELPDGVGGEPTYQVADRVTATFTFDARRASDAAIAAGKTLPPPPPGVDGSRARITAGPGVAEMWALPSGVPTLVVGRLTAPTVETSGVSFTTLRDYLLSLPGLPADVAAQLRAVTAKGDALPLLVPAGQATSTPTDVGGAPATLITARDGAVSGVVWVRDGVVTAVAGTVGADAVLAVARGLR
jgi:hypothetical protein